jgi:hypothetical protein
MKVKNKLGMKYKESAEYLVEGGCAIGAATRAAGSKGRQNSLN